MTDRDVARESRDQGTGTESHEQPRPDLPKAVDLPPSPGDAFGDEATGGDVEVDRTAGGGLDDSGAVDLHGSDEGLRQAPVGDDPVGDAGRDFMDLNRSTHA